MGDRGAGQEDLLDAIFSEAASESVAVGPQAPFLDLLLAKLDSWFDGQDRGE